MKRFKNILVVYDSKTDNGALFDRSVEHARRNHTALTVVDVLEEAPNRPAMPSRPGPAVGARVPGIRILEEYPTNAPGKPASESPPADWNRAIGAAEHPLLDIQEHIKQDEQSSLEQFVAAIRKAGIEVSGRMLYGTPFLEIIREVLRNRHDLVMITAEGRGGVNELLFGNTTIHLMRKCPCPVWVIKPGRSTAFGRILAAVDLVPDDEERISLNTKIMELAVSLARLGESKLHIVHAWIMYGEPTLRSGHVMLTTEAVERMLRETQAAHRQWLIELLQRHPMGGVDYEAYLLKGEAGLVIPELARAKAIDLIVMGTVSRAGIAGLFIGNTAEKVMHRVDCSMLTVKPEGFVTPVKQEPE